MTYQIQLPVDPNHIDFQNILNNCYYLHYMEKARHVFLQHAFEIDIIQAAKQGYHYVLYAVENLIFHHSVKPDDLMTITCQLTKATRTKMTLYQQIWVDEQLTTEATLIATCVPTDHTRPFIPHIIRQAARLN